MRHGWNVLISGETGTGKTWLGYCIATAAIRQAIKSKYYRLDDLLYEMALMRADGELLKFKAKLSKYYLLVLDDFGVTPMTQQGKSDFWRSWMTELVQSLPSSSDNGRTTIGIPLSLIQSSPMRFWTAYRITASILSSRANRDGKRRQTLMT